MRLELFGRSLRIVPFAISVVLAEAKKSIGEIKHVGNGIALPRMVGMNLAGLDFGAINDGSYIIGNAVTPPVNQIPHFTKQGANVIRVNFAWPYIQSKLNGELNKTSLDNLRGIVDAVLENGAYAILDLHSYARFDRKIVGESDIKAEALVDVWRRLAKSFPQKDILYGITNEPHDLKMETWADTMKTIVAELRKDGVTNIILIPGNEFTSLQAFPKWYPFLKDITNPDGSTDNLIFEAHRYLDVDNSGTHTECTASNVADVEEALKILQKDGRQLILAETGGGNTESCEKFLPEFFEAIVKGYPSIIGGLLWAGGAFDEKYELVITVAKSPEKNDWVDQSNWKSIQKFLPPPGKGRTNCKANKKSSTKADIDPSASKAKTKA